MSLADTLEIGGKVAGLGGMSIALIGLILRSLVATGVLKTLLPADRAPFLRWVIGCALASSLAGLATYLIAIQQKLPPGQPSLSVGRTADIKGNATLEGQTKIGKDFNVGKDLKINSPQPSNDGR